jgi:hypothetical protein
MIVQRPLIHTHNRPSTRFIHPIVLPSCTSWIEKFVDELRRCPFPFNVLEHWIPRILLIWALNRVIGRQDSLTHIVVFAYNSFDIEYCDSAYLPSPNIDSSSHLQPSNPPCSSPKLRPRFLRTTIWKSMLYFNNQAKWLTDIPNSRRTRLSVGEFSDNHMELDHPEETYRHRGR